MRLRLIFTVAIQRGGGGDSTCGCVITAAFFVCVTCELRTSARVVVLAAHECVQIPSLSAFVSAVGALL